MATNQTATSEESVLRLEIRAKAEAVYDAHSNLLPDAIEEQLYEHLDAEFPDASMLLISEVIENVMEANDHGI
jgi:hypothetical protein